MRQGRAEKRMKDDMDTQDVYISDSLNIWSKLSTKVCRASGKNFEYAAMSSWDWTFGRKTLGHQMMARFFVSILFSRECSATLENH